MSTSRLDRLASAAADELLDTTATETNTLARRADLDRLRRNRRGARLTAVATVMVAVLTVLFVQGNFSTDSDPQPMEPVPGIDIGDVPVWYDDAGLHRGNVVEPTPIELRQHAVDAGKVDGVDGALALVRTGAVYLDPATGDVWFHPWGGDPHIVGHNSEEGPGADPNGDTAAWFEGYELVVYDTAVGREISRTWQTLTVSDCNFLCGEHFQGNRFLQVSTERVVWAGGPSGDKTYNYDVSTQRTSVVSPESAFVLGVSSGAEELYADLEVGRLRPSGDYVLGVEPTKEHLAVVVDARTGQWWRVPESGDPSIAWSYGDIALVNTKDGLRACDAARRTCETLPAERPLLMPTN